MSRWADPRMAIGALFIVGYYGTIWLLGFAALPKDNVPLVKDALLQLGPPVGAIIYALFRTDRVDEQRAATTSDAFQAVTAAARAGTPTATDGIRDGDTVTMNKDPNA